MGDRLAGGHVAIALLANTLSTGAVLVALILTFGSISGAHFNPAVSFADASQGGLSWPESVWYSAAQVTGAVMGVGAADIMFELPAYSWSTHVRAGGSQVFSEMIATFGLLAPLFVVGQAIGAAAATALFRWLVPPLPETADAVLMPHPASRTSNG